MEDVVVELEDAENISLSNKIIKIKFVNDIYLPIAIMMAHTMEHVLAVQQQNRGSSTSLMVSGVFSFSLMVMI